MLWVGVAAVRLMLAASGIPGENRPAVRLILASAFAAPAVLLGLDRCAGTAEGSLGVHGPRTEDGDSQENNCQREFRG